MEMNRYNLDIAALGGTRLPGYNSLEDHGYILFWSEKLVEATKEGVSFALKKHRAS